MSDALFDLPYLSPIEAAVEEIGRRLLETEWHDMTDALFDLPDEGELMPRFALPDDEPDVLPPEEPPTIRELMISPDVDAYLTMLETAIAPYEATAKAFAEQMAHAPIDTPEQLATLGQQSLVAKEREKLLDELFEPAIRKPQDCISTASMR